MLLLLLLKMIIIEPDVIAIVIIEPDVIIVIDIVI